MRRCGLGNAQSKLRFFKGCSRRNTLVRGRSMYNFNGGNGHGDGKTDKRIDTQEGVSKRTRLVANTLRDPINKSLQSLHLILGLGRIIVDGNRFRQGGKGCGAIT